jgi:hypothetical protein
MMTDLGKIDAGSGIFPNLFQRIDIVRDKITFYKIPVSNITRKEAVQVEIR